MTDRLLTDEQREIMDKAFKEQQQAEQNQRRVQLESQNAVSTTRRKLNRIAQKIEDGGGVSINKKGPKKAGASGKFRVRDSDSGDLLSPVAQMDHNDPNYDSEDENEFEQDEQAFEVTPPKNGQLSKSPQKSQVSPTKSAEIQRENVARQSPSMELRSGPFCGQRSLSTSSLDNQKNVEAEKFKKECSMCVKEFFDSEDFIEVARTLTELSQSQEHYIFIKIAYRLSMDKNDKERQLIQLLINYLFLKNVISQEQIYKAFTLFLKSADDIVLDVPDYKRFVSSFIVSAAVNEIIDVQKLKNTTRFWGSTKLGPDTIQEALTATKETTNFESNDENDWEQVNVPPKVQSPREAQVEQIEKQIDQQQGGDVVDYKTNSIEIWKQFYVNGDPYDTADQFKALSNPNLKFIFVKQGIRLSMDRSYEERQSTSTMLHFLFKKGFIGQQDLEPALKELLMQASDIVLDVPSVVPYLSIFVMIMDAHGFIDQNKLREDLHQYDDPLIHRIFNASGDKSTFRLQQVDLSYKNGDTSGDSIQKNDEKLYKNEFLDLVKEYFDSEDLNEVARTLDDLNVSQLHHIFVKQAIRLSLDRGPKDRHLLKILIQFLYIKNIITSQDVAVALKSLKTQQKDLILDVPNFYGYIDSFVKHFKISCIIDDKCLD